jgi:hypothetical protein
MACDVIPRLSAHGRGGRPTYIEVIGSFLTSGILTLATHSRLSATGQSEAPNHVRIDGSFPRKRSLDAGDGCTAGHCQPCSQLVAELAPIADHGAGNRGICSGPRADSCGAARAPATRRLCGSLRTDKLFGPGKHDLNAIRIAGDQATTNDARADAALAQNLQSGRCRKVAEHNAHQIYSGD